MSRKSMYENSMNVRLSKEIMEKFKKKCEKNGRQVSEIIRQLVSEYIMEES